MLVARVLYPVEVLGIGRRIGIWFCGCHRKCDCCSNPELWEFDEKKFMPVNDVYDYIYTIFNLSKVDGFTITGGEPFEQIVELNRLVAMISGLSRDIIIYSGYTKAELLAKKEPAVKNILNNIAVLIDGRYIKERNNGVFMRGSDNQAVHILNKSFKKTYTEFFKNGTNTIQNFKASDGIFPIGLHRAGFNENFDELISNKGGMDQ